MRHLKDICIPELPWTLTYLHHRTPEGTKIYCAEIESADSICLGTFDIDEEQFSPEMAGDTASIISTAPELYSCLREAIIETCHNCPNCSRDSKYKCLASNNKCFVKRWRETIAKAGNEKMYEEEV